MQANFTPRNIVYPEMYSNIECTVEKTIAAECCRQDTKEAMIFIKNKYELMIFTNIYKINQYFSNLSTKTSYVTGSILHRGAVRLSILTYALTQGAVIIIIRHQNLN